MNGVFCKITERATIAMIGVSVAVNDHVHVEHMRTNKSREHFISRRNLQNNRIFLLQYNKIARYVLIFEGNYAIIFPNNDRLQDRVNLSD